MKKQYLGLSSLAIFAVMFMVFGSCAYADNTSQFIQSIRTDRVKVEAQLGIDPQADNYPHATSYYDDKEAHYEQVLIMSDFIDKGIR